jgi:hypothetical protein
MVCWTDAKMIQLQPRWVLNKAKNRLHYLWLQHFSRYQYRYFPARGVTKRCRLAWLTNNAFGYEPKCRVGVGGGGGCGVSATEYSCCAHGAQINFGDLIIYLTYVLSFLLLLSSQVIVFFFKGKTPMEQC